MKLQNLMLDFVTGYQRCVTEDERVILQSSRAITIYKGMVDEEDRDLICRQCGGYLAPCSRKKLWNVLRFN